MANQDEGDMKQAEHKIVIIGGGIAGLCAGVYARKCGYEVELLAPHHAANARPPHGQKSDLEDRAKRLSP